MVCSHRIRYQQILSRVHKQLRPPVLLVLQVVKRIRLRRIASRSEHKLNAMVHILDEPHQHQADGDEQRNDAIQRLLFAVDRRDGPIQADHLAVTRRRIENRTLHLQRPLRVANGERNVLVQIGAAVAEHMKDQRMLVEVHVEDELEDLLADRLHGVALPEQIFNGRRVSDGDKPV